VGRYCSEDRSTILGRPAVRCATRRYKLRGMPAGEEEAVMDPIFLRGYQISREEAVEAENCEMLQLALEGAVQMFLGSIDHQPLS
jgi:hypothetical protein